MADNDNKPKRVPARYIGHHAVNVVAALGPYYNADGTRRTSLIIETGDELLMPEREILGYTIRYIGESAFDLGTGRRVAPEHADLGDIELSLLRYEFHQGRADFEPLTAVVPALPDAAPAQVPDAVIAAANIAQPSATNGG